MGSDGARALEAGRVVDGGLEAQGCNLPDAGDAHDDLGHRVHALVECKPGASIDANGLWEHVASLIVRYKVPRQFEFVTEPLRDSAGKVRRSALREERIGESAGAR